MSEAVSRRCSGGFAKFTGGFATLAGKVCNFIKKETLAQVLFCEFYKISKSTFFYKTPTMAVSIMYSIFI